MARKKYAVAIRKRFFENINVKKLSITNLKQKFQTYSLKIQSSEPLWKLAITLLFRVNKDKKIAVGNILRLINYYLKLITKKYLISTPQYCEDAWKCFDELWSHVETNIKYTNLMKRNSMAIEQITANLIDLNVLTLEVSSGPACFDIFKRLSFLHDQKRGTDLDILLHCKTLVVPLYRKMDHYITVLRQISEKYSEKIYDCSTFLKLCLLARIMLIMAKVNSQCKDLLIVFCQELKIPNSSDYEKFGNENKLPASNATMKLFIKNMDVVSVFNSLYSQKKVNLMDETFEISERQESLKCKKELHPLKNKFCEEKSESLMEPRDLFPTQNYDSSLGSLRNMKNGKNIENVDPLDYFRPNASNETEGKKSAKQLLKTKKSKNFQFEIASKSSKSNCKNLKNIAANSVQRTMDVSNPRDLFSVPEIVTIHNKKINKLALKENKVSKDSFRSKKTTIKESISSCHDSSNKEKNHDCDLNLLPPETKSMNQPLKRAKISESSISPVDELEIISKKQKVKSGMRKRKRNVKNDSYVNCVNEPDSKKIYDSISTSSQPFENKNNILEDIVNATSTILNFKENQDSKVNTNKKIKLTLAKLKSKLDKTCNNNDNAKLKLRVGKTCSDKGSVEGNKCITVKIIEDKNDKIRKPRMKKLKCSKANTDQEIKFDDYDSGLGETERKQTISSQDPDFWSTLTGENNEHDIKSEPKKRRRRRPKQLDVNELCPKIKETKSHSKSASIDGSTGIRDSDVEIIEESHSSDSATKSEDSEIDEASGSDDEIVPNDETCFMFTEEESSVFDKNFKEERRKSKELDLESKIVEILEKRREKEIILGNKRKDGKKENSVAITDDSCSSKRKKVGCPKEMSNVSPVTINLGDDSVHFDSDDELKIILTKTKNVSCNNIANELITSKQFDLNMNGTEVPSKFHSQTNFSENNDSDEVSFVTEYVKYVPSKHKVNKLVVHSKSDCLIANDMTESDNLNLHMDENEIDKLNLELYANGASICGETNICSEQGKCQHFSSISGSPQKYGTPIKVKDSSIDLSNARRSMSTMSCDINTEDSVSSTSDVGDEAYEAGCSDSSDDNEGNKYGKSKQKRLSSEESSSLLPKRRRQSSYLHLQKELNHFPLFTYESETCISSNLGKVASPLNDESSFHLEIEVSSDDASENNEIESIATNAKLNLLFTDDKCQLETSNESDHYPLAKSLDNHEASEVSIVDESSTIRSINDDESEKSECLSNSNTAYENLNVSNENIQHESDILTVSKNENFAKDEAPVTDSSKNDLKKSISPLNTVDAAGAQYNIHNSLMSGAVLGTAIESIMAATNYTFQNGNSVSTLSKSENNKENNEQEGEELEVLSTSSLEIEEASLVKELATPVSEEKISRSPSSRNVSNTANKSLFTLGKRRKSVQEIKSPCKRNLLTINSPHFQTPQKVPTSALMGSELIISPGVSDDENEIGKEINSQAKIIESLPSVDQPDPWIRSKSPQKITQEEQIDIIDKSFLSEILIKKSPIKLVSKNNNNLLLNEIHSVNNFLPSLSAKSPLLLKTQLFTSPSKKLRSTSVIINSKSPSPRSTKSTKSPLKLDNSIDSHLLTLSQSIKSSRLSLNKTRKSHRISVNIDSISPLKNEYVSGFSSEINTQKVSSDKPALMGTTECNTESIINNLNTNYKDAPMVPNVLNIDTEPSVICKLEAIATSPTKSSISPKSSQLETEDKNYVEKLEDSVPSDSEDRDKVFSPIKRTTRSSTMAARRLSITSTGIDEIDLNSPRRTKRSSVSSVITQDDLLSAKKLLDSPVRARTRRNSSANTLTPIRRSRRISGIIDELK